MTDSINRYQVYCIEEGTFVETLSETVPTECPNTINHTSRAINPDLTSIVETFYKNSFRAEENSDGDFETTHIKMDIPSGTPGDITEHDVSWPMDILLWITYLTPMADMIGDEVTVMADPERQVGVIVAPVNIGDTTFTIDPGAFDYLVRGYLITLNDGVNKDVVGRITAIDKGASTITVDTPASFSFAPMTQLQRSVYVLKDLYIFNTETIPIGKKGFKGKMVPAGVNLRVYYTNNSGTSKTFRWRPEYYNHG